MDQKKVDILLDTMLHKELVLASCWKMANFFLSQKEIDRAIEIIERGWLHDNSKFSDEEIALLSKVDDNKASMRDADKQLSDEMREFLKLHYKNNTHHPEHWDDVSQMPEMDVVEMCCDWHARSVQYGTNLLEFAKIRQECRFHFSTEMFERIIFYCNILVS